MNGWHTDIDNEIEKILPFNCHGIYIENSIQFKSIPEVKEMMEGYETIKINSISILEVDNTNYKAEEALAKPPAGRSQQHHNNIIRLNKKKRGA